MSERTYRHHCSVPVKLDRDWQYREQGTLGNGKPSGLWVAVKGRDDWEHFCRSEGFAVEDLACEHVVELADDANILYIESPAALWEFHHEYRRPFDTKLEREVWGSLGKDARYERIDWERVASEYDGIMIPNYLWEERLAGPFWYYGWDCASGCIWNLSAIKEIRWAIPALEEFRRQTSEWIEVAFERASNRLAYGTPDPTGGAGRQPYPIGHPMFPKPLDEECSCWLHREDKEEDDDQE